MSRQTSEIEEERVVKIRIMAHSGDKVQLKLPINFVKKMVKNNALDFIKGLDDVVDSNKLLNMMVNAFDYNLLGEIAHLERHNGDIIRIRID